MASISLDENMASTLTDEELEAIKEDEFDENDREALKSIAGDGDEDSGDDGSDEDSEDEGGDAELPGAAAADDGKAVSADDGFRPTYQASLPEDFAAQSEAIKAEAAELATKYRDNEIDFDEYTTAIDGINVRRDALTAAKIKADIAVEMKAQEGQQHWAWTVDRFIRKTAADEQIDYHADAAKLKDLDLFIRALASDPSHASQSAEWFLAEAHKRVKAMHGIAVSRATETTLTKPPARKPNLSAVPKTLAHVPGSDGPGDVDSEFADIYQLDGLDYETAIAKMSPAQREKFARVG